MFADDFLAWVLKSSFESSLPFFVCVFDAQVPASTSVISKGDLKGRISSSGQRPNKVRYKYCFFSSWS